MFKETGVFRRYNDFIVLEFLIERRETKWTRWMLREMAKKPVKSRANSDK